MVLSNSQMAVMKPVASPGWGQHRTVATDSHSHRGLPSSSIRTCLSEGVHSFGRSPCLRSIIMSLTAGFRTMATRHISASNNAYEQSAAVHAVGTHFSAASTNRTNGRAVPSCHHTHMPHLTIWQLLLFTYDNLIPMRLHQITENNWWLHSIRYSRSRMARDHENSTVQYWQH